MHWYWQHGTVDADFQDTKIKGGVLTEKCQCSVLWCDTMCIDWALAVKVALNWRWTGMGGEPYGVSWIVYVSSCAVGMNILKVFCDMMFASGPKSIFIVIVVELSWTGLSVLGYWKWVYVLRGWFACCCGCWWVVLPTWSNTVTWLVSGAAAILWWLGARSTSMTPLCFDFYTFSI